MLQGPANSPVSPSIGSSGLTFGYHGRYLRVDVGSGVGDFIPLGSDILRKYLGGCGLGVYLLLSENAAEMAPLAPGAAIAFVFSPLVGSPLTTSAKFAVVSKSPLTGRINDSLASSGFALAGKKCGGDAIVVTGRADRPSILVIDDGEVRMEPADDLWGQTCQETQAQLHERFPGDWQTAVIGPAGERQVLYATISHDGRHAGRGGSGAVLGSKNIKALVVRGSQRCEWADPGAVTKYARQLSERSFGPATAKYRELGTISNLLVFNRLHALPTRNFQQGSFSEAAALSPESLSLNRSKVRASCVACTIGCEHIFSLKPTASEDAPAADSPGVRLEYENLFALGPLCGIGDPDVVLRASQRCDELGIDTISAGGTIAFAMECAERGSLDAPELRFGNGAAMLRAIEEIGLRTGLGDQLANGSRWLAKQIGRDSIAFAPQVKGLEIPGYEPRALQTMALGLAVGTRGADHNRSGAYEADFSDQVDRRHLDPSSAKFAVETENKAALLDSLILCKFLRGVFSDVYAEAAEMLHLITGWEVTAQELRQAAIDIVTAKKIFNVRCGWTPAEDTLPARFLDEPSGDDATARLTAEQLAQAIQEYNRLRGWSKDGYPT